MTNEELVAEYQKGNEMAFEELLASNMGIIGTFLKKWWFKVESGSITPDELKSECQFAFFLSALEYRTDRECSFSSYAFNRISWWLKKNLNKPVPVNSSGEEIRIVSLTDQIPGADGATYETYIPDPDAEQQLQLVLDRLATKSLKERLLFFLDSVCSEREKDIITKRYGIGCKQVNLSEIAEQLDLSTSRVQQIEEKALMKLRNSPIKDSIFEEFKPIHRKASKAIMIDELIDVSTERYTEALMILKNL
ncbi:sigma-70 family RNA polymerase sigma factor [bacterium]|nr:sigma-70 family RNA polymerase sigma factor [bacterium]